jgi:hypothetical protein
LSFDFVQTRIPSNLEVIELVNATDAFLESRLDDPYPGTTVTLSTIESTFRLMQPFEVIIGIVLHNLPASSSVPTTEELDGAVATILQDPASLEALIAAAGQLSEDNVFRTITAITFLGQAIDSSSTTKRGNRNVVAGASAAAILVALLLLGGGYQQWGGRSRGYGGNNRKPSKTLYQQCKVPIDGSGQTVSVSGETCGITTIATKASHHHHHDNHNSKQTRFAFDEGMSLTSSPSSEGWATSAPPPHNRGSADGRLAAARSAVDNDEEADCYGLRPLFSDAMYESISEEDEKVEEEMLRAAVDLLAQPSQENNNIVTGNRAASSSDPMDTDDMTVDSYVPLRVVDLIKRWNR